jgi:TonB family protein
VESNDQGSSPGFHTPGEVLKNRVEALRTNIPAAGPDPKGAVCKECGSPLSDTNKFCWMCGATRDSDLDPRVDLGRNGGPRLVNPNPSTDQEDATSPPSTILVNGSLALSPKPEFGPGLEPSAERRVPEPAYAFEGEPYPEFPSDFAPARADEEPKKAPKYRTVAVLVLAVVIAALGYWQKNNFLALFAIVKTAVSQELSSWQGDDTAVNVSHRETTTAANKIRRHVHNAAPVTDTRAVNAQPVPAPTPRRLPLGVQVRGQHLGKPPVITATDGIYHNGVVEVGISDPWITNARLSPMAIEVSPRESLALLIKRVPPIYPEAALRANLQGSVVLKVVIRKDGNVGDLRAMSGDPLLVPAAVESVRQWIYKPYYRDGVPTEIETVVVVDFSLASQSASASVEQ